MIEWQGSWIWTCGAIPERNVFIRFRRSFDYSGGRAVFHITADSRYVLYVNGCYAGQGPVRAWPAHWRYDTYDLEPHLHPGMNIISVLVNHFGEGSFQYIPSPPGLLAQLELADRTIPTDDSWRASPDRAFVSSVPRISLQEGFEEQFDARLDDGWHLPDYDDSSWDSASVVRPANDGIHLNLRPRGIPFLTMEPVLPQRVVSAEVIKSVPHRFTIRVKPYLTEDRSSNAIVCHAYLATQIWSPSEAEVEFGAPHKNPGAMKINGQPVEAGMARLRNGWNEIIASIHGFHHSTMDFVACMDGPSGLEFSCTGEPLGSPWAVVGPFGLCEEDREKADTHVGSPVVVVDEIRPSATCSEGDAFWSTGSVSSVVDRPYFRQILPEHLPSDVFVQAYTDRAVECKVVIEDDVELLSGSGWAIIRPDAEGRDVRVLLDFGREVVGFHRFEISAPAGTVVDFHNFEFIQPDGRYNLAEGMNNSFRYICRAGVQSYQTYLRRGFQYSYLILRNTTGPVHLRRVETLFSTYPQARRGDFACSDAKLTRIWEVGAHTLRCCSEDTYTDCPTYEQTHWVGDARNEALVDWVVNGDPCLWYRCLQQTGHSLDRSTITESHVPSAWQNILPAWSFLWMRSCREYLLFTGDIEGSRELLNPIERNVDGILKHLNAQGLFDIKAWNMFDWAAMDTPVSGVVTHQNCLAVQALRDTAEMAELLGKLQLGRQWREIADSLANAINAYLWNDEVGAYTDCLRDGKPSPVYSQQTQAAAYMSRVASGARADRCSELIHNPREGFVKAGSPFFEFFLLEAYQRERKEREFLGTIREDWGFMVDLGATTFWEMWSGAEQFTGQKGRLTRSHCHGWSAAPTFFLSTYVLGVSPGGTGFSSTIIEPHPGDLTWCRGRVPTPAGNVEVQWENYPERPFKIHVLAPQDLETL